MDLERQNVIEMNNTTSSFGESSESLNVQRMRNYDSINGQSTMQLVKEEEQEESFLKKNKSTIYKFIVLLLLISYFLWATYYQIFVLQTNVDATLCTGYGFLIIVYSFIAFGISYSYLLGPRVVPQIKTNVWTPLTEKFRNSKYAAIIFYIVFFVALGIFLAIDTANDRYRLISLAGLALFLLFGFVMCPFKSHIKWTTLINGMVLQFTLALLIIKWPPGEAIFNCIGDKVTTFLGYAAEGAAFVYGDTLIYKEGVFAFKSLCTIYFLSFIINILYYYGLMQKFVSALGKFFKFWLGTSICESVNSAANIFLGMTEAPLLLKPFLAYLTDSELHDVMTCGFATTSGTVLAAYITFGANASTLITASVMSAPSALVFSKLMYPETEEPQITQENVSIADVPYDSVLDAAITGASDAIKMVLNIIAGVIACLSFVYFLNGCLTWMGILVGYTTPQDAWTVNAIVGKLFIPIAFLMGVPYQDCSKVAELIGLKTMVNEFVAFQRMSQMVLMPKSKTIATFAICGFANPGSVGIMISGLSALMPSKKPVITRLVFRAAAGGAVVCFMTACITGVFIPTNATTS
ncbi:hypothetical protein WA026_011159 [Henosepilachna vigintioctopunctata]|uniref:Sodium/nucleoside cotransporter n=1 Tax=Henosepilachna vigintioctopunctata TaxID=420089 RepID=A0AAW1U5U4_9CUCU